MSLAGSVAAQLRAQLARVGEFTEYKLQMSHANHSLVNVEFVLKELLG